MKVPCGGFRIDDDTLKLKDDGTLYAVGGGVQPDWNQNDSTALNYIKNRPFYSETTETVLVEESTVPFTSLGAGLYYATIQSAFKPLPERHTKFLGMALHMNVLVKLLVGTP